MEINPTKVTIRDLSENYEDNDEGGVVGYNGVLNIRPKFQREFVYHDKQRNAVIDSVMKSFPLNVMYWSKNDMCSYGEYTFEVLDGQQRTISICQYVHGDFSVEVNGNTKYFHTLSVEEQNQILDYEVDVFVCEGSEADKLDWFTTINIAGAVLTPQELRNSVYTGTWLSDAKGWFSKPNCGAIAVGQKYLKGVAIRQDYLETAIKWISDDNIEDYMSSHQHEDDADELWEYFEAVLKWVQTTFNITKSTYRKEMKGIGWGFLYNEFKDTPYDHIDMESKVKELMMNDDVQKKSGIYSYLLNGDEKELNIRSFTDNQKREAYEQLEEDGVCVKCGNTKTYTLEQMEGDHITPFAEGGKTVSENCQMLCVKHNREKGCK